MPKTTIFILCHPINFEVDSLSFHKENKTKNILLLPQYLNIHHFGPESEKLNLSLICKGISISAYIRQLHHTVFWKNLKPYECRR